MLLRRGAKVSFSADESVLDPGQGGRKGEKKPFWKPEHLNTMATSWFIVIKGPKRTKSNQIKSWEQEEVDIDRSREYPCNIYLARHHSVARSHAALIGNIRCFDACSFDELDFERVHRKFFALLLLNLSITLKRLESAMGVAQHMLCRSFLSHHQPCNPPFTKSW